ncbi:unnamed protein product, partial [Oppiella nova]
MDERGTGDSGEIRDWEIVRIHGIYSDKQMSHHSVVYPKALVLRLLARRILALLTMDTFYEENQENNIKMLKNKMTLDFNSPTSHSKKSKLMKTCILESPDLKMCKLGSPELERMIIQHNGMVTTTPTPSAGLSYLMKQEQEVTEEQEQYARGFVEALNQLHRTNGHNNNQTIPTTNGGQQHLHPHHQQQQQHPHHPQQQHPNPQLMNNSQLNTINNHSNNNNLSNNQNTSHLNSNQNLMNSSNSNNNSHSSDSSQDLTIADTTAANNTGAARRNSYHMLVPPPPQQVVVTTASAPVVTSCYDSNNNQTMNGGMGANGGGVKFAVPHMPSHDQQSHQQPQQQQQYVQVSTGSMTSGAHVLINNSVNTTTANTTSASILPPYSQAVSSN